MLINCPKCGFSQPKDHYCASCGVDMDSFRPAELSFSKQLMRNPGALSLAMVALILCSIAYIRIHRSHEIASTTETESHLVIAKRSAPGKADESSRAAVMSRVPVPVPEPPPAAAAATPVSATTDAVAAQIAEEDKAQEVPAAAVKVTNLKMRAIYAEVDKVALRAWFEESRELGQATDFGDFKSGSINNLAARLDDDNIVHILQTEEKTFNPQELKQKWFVGKKRGEDNVGLTTLVTLMSTGDEQGHIRGEVEVMRNIHDMEGRLQKRSFPITGFDLPPKNAWMMSVNMPPVDQLPGEMGVEGILRLFQSGQFLKGMTEFTLFLDFDTRSL